MSKCLNCGERLKVYVVSKACDNESKIDPRHEVTRRFRDTQGLYAYSYKAGFGHHGDGIFCSAKCGYEWAVTEVKRDPGRFVPPDVRSHPFPVRQREVQNPES